MCRGCLSGSSVPDAFPTRTPLLIGQHLLGRCCWLKDGGDWLGSRGLLAAGPAGDWLLGAAGGCWGLLGAGCWGLLGAAGGCWGLLGAAGGCWGVSGARARVCFTCAWLSYSSPQSLSLKHSGPASAACRSVIRCVHQAAAKCETTCTFSCRPAIVCGEQLAAT